MSRMAPLTALMWMDTIFGVLKAPALRRVLGKGVEHTRRKIPKRTVAVYLNAKIREPPTARNSSSNKEHSSRTNPVNRKIRVRMLEYRLPRQGSPQFLHRMGRDPMANQTSGLRYQAPMISSMDQCTNQNIQFLIR